MSIPLPETVWYRYEDMRYAPPLDEFDSPCGSGRTELVLCKYGVVKVTEKGVWLDSGRFVLRGARKRFACPTEAEAMESFLARKNRQLRILRAQIESIEEALSQASAGNTAHPTHGLTATTA